MPFQSTEPQPRPFEDRADAGEKLARMLTEFELSDPIVLGLARGGVIVAAPIAQRLDADLDVFVARKLGAPGQPEYAVGAIAEGVGGKDDVVLIERAAADAVGATRTVIDLRIGDERAEMARRLRRYRGERDLPSIRDRDVILVDDGIATGHTARASVNALKAGEPSRLILAVPVAPRSALRQFSDIELVVLRRPEPFRAVGEWYRDFGQVSDHEMLKHLAASARRR